MCTVSFNIIISVNKIIFLFRHAFKSITFKFQLSECLHVGRFLLSSVTLYFWLITFLKLSPCPLTKSHTKDVVKLC